MLTKFPLEAMEVEAEAITAAAILLEPTMVATMEVATLAILVITITATTVATSAAMWVKVVTDQLATQQDVCSLNLNFDIPSGVHLIIILFA